MFICYKSVFNSCSSSSLQVDDFSRPEKFSIFSILSIQFLKSSLFTLFLKDSSFGIHRFQRSNYSDIKIQLSTKLSDHDSDNWKLCISMRFNDLQRFGRFLLTDLMIRIFLKKSRKFLRSMVLDLIDATSSEYDISVRLTIAYRLRLS